MTTKTTDCTRKSRGRPKVSGREAALSKAMMLLWQHEYEAVSLADLVEAIGAKIPTLYTKFANKEGLFRAVLGHYITRLAAKYEVQLFCGEENLESVLEDYFTAIATCFTNKDTPVGCFMTNTSTTLAASSRDIAYTTKSRHTMQEQTSTQFLHQRQQRGEIPARYNVQKLAEYLNCILQGMSISAREDATSEKLMQIAHTTLYLWPELVRA